MTARVLVAYATKHGSTAEIADLITEALRLAGLDAEVTPAKACSDIGPFDAVVLGSAVYLSRWQPDALDFAKRFESELDRRPTWFFSSGPTGGTPAAEAKLAEVVGGQPWAPGDAGRLARRVGIRGHATFAGRVGDDMTGILERWLPRGDWRDRDAIATWAASIAAELNVGRPVPQQVRA